MKELNSNAFTELTRDEAMSIDGGFEVSTKSNNFYFDEIPCIILAMQVKDDSKVGLTLINVTFKWIKAGGGNRLPDGMFLKIGGKKNTIIKNCQFYNIITQYGHSCIVHLNKGTATFENCSIINCTNGYGCLSVFNRNGASVAMIVKNCYFENNYVLLLRIGLFGGLVQSILMVVEILLFMILVSLIMLLDGMAEHYTLTVICRFIILFL